MNYKNPIGITLFSCIILVVIITAILWLSNKLDTFYGKRNTRIKIYKSDEILDPDELPEYDESDPDDKPFLFDPDQQPMLNDQSISYYPTK